MKFYFRTFGLFGLPDYLYIMSNFPEAFRTQMQQLLGTEYTAFEDAFKMPAPVSIRLNPLKYAGQVQHQKIPWTGQGYYLDSRPVYTADPFLHAGVYYVQEASSMFLEQAFRQHTDLSTNLKVLDLCAAPGGKSTHILSLISRESLLVANEVIRNRAMILQENLVKWGNPNVVITSSDPDKFASLEGFFDVLVVDAPCSGEGLFRRDADAMNEWSPAHVSSCASRQQRILSDVWSALKPGGILIYSTCTFNSQEDENILQWLIDTYEAEPLSIRTEASWGVSEVTTPAGGKGYKFFPHKVSGEGYFMTVLRKTSGENFTPLRKQKNPFVALPKNVSAETSQWLKTDIPMTGLLFGERILSFPEMLVPDIITLAGSQHIIGCGTETGEWKKKNVIPSHALALSPACNREAFAAASLNYRQALKYLTRDTFDLELEVDGWTMVYYLNIPLGWIKKIGNRFNNYYPMEWRIRMDTTGFEVPPTII